MLRLLLPIKHKDAKIFENHLNPVMNSFHLKYSQMSALMPGFQLFLGVCIILLKERCLSKTNQQIPFNYFLS